MLIVITGNGKGKTTSALGQAFRSVGDGKKVLMLQFIKGPWKSGEDNFLPKFQIPNAQFQIRKGGLGFVGILGDKLPREEHEEAARKTLDEAFTELRSGNWEMIILDEANVALDLNLIKLEKVLDFCREARNKKIDVILTGRDAPQELIDVADIVSEIREVKHIYNEGKKARKGIEY
ncbi:MAG: cob(I)yrinic acid a,c-diamide adenosyltransferase [bacterium]|nr:cob(I)yrinic acid a,c-diamide adenosyltransferase [bacterium]